MQQLIFDKYGKPIGVKNKEIRNKSISKQNLKTSDSLDFLKEDEDKLNDIFSKDYWSLYSNGEMLKPLKFANGKTQEDVVKEIVEKTKNHKIIFLHGTCGSGKSAIALNVARVLGKTSIVVPVKALQKQYEDDYITKKYLRKEDGSKMKIAMVTGKDNHDSIIKPGYSCADPELPENIKITEKNYDKLIEYAKDNPYINNLRIRDIKDVRRATVAAANPYWSPILPADFELKIMTDARKKRYVGANGRDYIFYHRKRGCSYYDQYLSYVQADAIIFNSAKYKAEISIGRKPLTEVDIIDEADEFLDSFFKQDSLNLTILAASLKNIHPSTLNGTHALEKIKKLIDLEEKNKKATGIREGDVFHVADTKIRELIEIFNLSPDLEAEITLDELNYANKAVEIAKGFENSLSDLYLTYSKDAEGNLKVNLVSSNLAAKFKELMDKTKTLIFMSGTLHSENIIKNIFGIKDFTTVTAEELNFGSTEIVKTGKEFDCKYANFKNNKYSREDYLNALSACIEKVTFPALIHVHSFADLPSEMELEILKLKNIQSSQELRTFQRNDKTGEAISDFKEGKIDKLFSTKCSRGVDFPGEVCNSVVFTKYPNPNVADTFWKVLQKTHPNFYWDFYKDKAWREFLQRIYRALRSPNDHVKILSPDSRVLDAVRKLQNGF